MPGPPAVPRAVLWLGLLVSAVVVTVAFVLPPHFGWEVASRSARHASPDEVPPLHGLWDPKLFGPGTLPAVAIALLGWRYAADLAQRLPWRGLLVASYAASLAWLLSLAFVEGPKGISRVLSNPYEYLLSARAVGNIPHLLDTYISRISYPAPDHWPTHVAGHPPAMLLFFVGLVRVGLGGDFAAGLVVTVLAASTAARRAGHLAGPRRRGVGPARGAVPGADPGRGLHGRVGRRRHRRRRRLGVGLPGPGDTTSVVGGARGTSAGDLRPDVLRHAADGVGRRRGAGRRTLLAAAPDRRCRRARRRAAVRRARDSRGGRPTRCFGSATSPASPRTDRSPTGGSATWPVSSSVPVRCCSRASSPRVRPPPRRRGGRPGWCCCSSGRPPSW